MFFIVRRISVLLLLFVFLFPREAELQNPNITSAPSSLLRVVDGESVTLQWTYTFGGSAFHKAQLVTAGVPFIVEKERFSSIFIIPAYDGRVTANITETNASITFFAVNSGDDGSYEFTVFNTNREFKLKSFTMEIQVPPSIDSFSSAQVVVEGNPPATIALFCNATGKPGPTVTWTKVFTNGSDSDTLFRGNSFEISNNRSNAGKYRCKADNGIGSAVNKTISMTVKFKAEIVQMTVNDSIICLGDAFSLSCSGDGNPAIDTYLLFENNTRVTTSRGPIVWAKTPSNVGETVYRCEVNNTLGTANATRTVTVNVGSVIQSVTSNIAVLEGENRNLTCDSTGIPVPSVTWTKVSTGNRTQGSTRELININRNDNGEYKCDASNVCGNDTKSIFLMVYSPLSVVPLENKTVSKGQSVILFCNVSGYPVPSVSWTHVRSGRKFRNATWKVTITDERNLGIYRCDLSNMYGNASDIMSVLFVGGFCEKACSNGRTCRAIGQFHSCLCSRGKKGTNCQGTEKLTNFVNVQFKFVEVQFEDVYTNLEDPKTMKLTKEIWEACFYEYQKQNKPLESARVAKLSRGSVIADVELKFLSEVSESEIKELTIKMTNDGKLGKLNVTSVVVGSTLTPPVTKEDCGAFFEGEDCKKGKPALLALTVLGALIVVGIIVAIVACKHHKKKGDGLAISKGVYLQPRNDPEGRGDNKGYKQERQDGTEMVTFSSNPAQTSGTSVNDSSIKKI